ncbi:MAG TPA: carboxypeptidase regulatory-like domain-containing protein [Candidatus Binatia bacterium]|nr:carboxypeptidase regulatory-like domain-containing protein [Candidatus Binatia bacterium]
MKTTSHRSRVWVSLLIVGSLQFGACSKSESPRRAATPLDPSTVGSIGGRATFSGSVPEPRRIELRGFAECQAQHAGPLMLDDVLVKDGMLQNVLVYIKSGLGDRVFAVPEASVVIDQRGCMFVPRVAGAQTGQEVRFMNADPLAHNVHGLPKQSSPWNFNLGVKGASRTLVIDKPENVIQLKCDVHPWMSAYLGVFDHPYFAVTDAAGHFELPAVPAGQYVVEAWHERFGTRTATVTVAPKQKAEVAFSFSN